MTSEMEKDILKVLVSEEELKSGCRSWAHSSMRSIRATDPCF